MVGTLQVKVLETTGREGAFSTGWLTPGHVCQRRRLPDGNGVSGAGSDVPAAVQSGWILEGPPGTGDDPTGRPQELCHVAAGWTQTDRWTDKTVSLCTLCCATMSCCDLTVRNP